VRPSRSVASERFSKWALVAAPAEMHVQGVSTRKVKAIIEELCTHSFSAAALSDQTAAGCGSAQFAGRPPFREKAPVALEKDDGY